MQTFTPSSATLPRVDIYVYATGNLMQAPLTVQIVELDDEDRPVGVPLFSTDVPANTATDARGAVSLYPNLSGLDRERQYGLLLKSPGAAGGGNAWGFGYSDANLYALGFERVSNDHGATWTTEVSGNRDLQFVTYR